MGRNEGGLMMKVEEIKEIARQRGIKATALKNLKKTELVRAVQVSEGNNACFNTGMTHLCGQHNCLWRVDCN